MDPERALLSIEGMDTSSGDSTEQAQSKTFIIILCLALAIVAREAAAMSEGQAIETRQILEEAHQNRQVNNPEPANADPAAASATLDIVPLELPKNLRVPSNMRPMLMRMLQRSATFRRQIVTLTAKPAVRVSVAYGGLRGDRHYQALSTVKKHQWGAMLVDTTIFVPADLVELIAHELEHVCEQVEGVDLRALSREGRERGVYDLNGHFETVRAIRAGQEATREYQDGPDSLQQTVRVTY